MVRLGIDVGIDAHRNIDRAALGRSDRRQQVEFRFRFNVDAENTFVDRERELARGLAQPREHDLVGRHAGEPRAHQFALRHHVGAGAERGERGDHRLIGIRLHGVADQRVHVGKGAGEHLVVPRERRGRIAIEWGPDRRGKRIEVHRLGVQHAVAISEVVHGLRFRWRVILSENRCPLFGTTRGLS